MMTAPGVHRGRRSPELTRVDHAIERLFDLQPRYAAAVRRLILRGEPATIERAVMPVDAARARASAAFAAWRAGTGSPQEVCEAHDDLVRLMIRVILGAR